MHHMFLKYPTKGTEWNNKTIQIVHLFVIKGK